MSRLEAKGRGILLFHDIHEHTVQALPEILKELKRNGYKVVQIVPANATIAKTATTSEQWRPASAQASIANKKAPPADIRPSVSVREVAKGTMAPRRRGPIRVVGTARKHRHPIAGGRAATRHVRDFGCGAPGRAERQLVSCALPHRRVI
jgi:hypothetical protein